VGDGFLCTQHSLGKGLKEDTSLLQSPGLGGSTALKLKPNSSPSSARLFQPAPKLLKFSTFSAMPPPYRLKPQ